jgi:tagaturonate epimerase
MIQLAKNSIGTGDRFGHQAKAQLRAVMAARDCGIDLVPVWNKSNREHTFTGSEPATVRQAADAAVRALGWDQPYHVDADHINIETVERFLGPSDFFTIDVAHFIGSAPERNAVEDFVKRHPELTGTIETPGLTAPIRCTTDSVMGVACKYLAAVQEAGRIYRHIVGRKGEDAFIAEVSMDETDAPQTPLELLIILAAIADEHIRLQTLAPKFTGRFNKGVDYAGDIAQFAREFHDDLAMVALSIERYGLPRNLKLSVHSGSDKFSIYRPIHDALTETGAGVHLKTAGTSWLEELIGLAEAGGNGLDAVKYIYRQAYQQSEALCQPYAAVIDIEFDKLPHPDRFDQWRSEEMAAAIRHEPDCVAFAPHVRQLLHVAFKVAAKMGTRYTRLLDEYEPLISRNVTANLLKRHILPLWGQ